MTSQEKFKSDMDYLSREILRLHSAKAALIHLKNTLEALGDDLIEVNAHSFRVTIGVTTRDAWAKIREALPKGIPKWTRSPSGDKAITYTTTYLTELCVNVGELPPSCKFEEVEELVPAVEATVKKVTKIVCQTENDPDAEVLA